MIKRYKNNYLVSDEGQVWKITNKGIRLKKLTKGNSGYFTTSINGKCMFVHRIVIEAFEGVST
ncbi:hypothetical protein, partial [Brucella sp. CMUL 015]|uniref:hypothetical protein n=1 Tax=Brucella sp. CMUL 015 TaxID=1905697 RepID=UPI0018E9DD97